MSFGSSCLMTQTVLSKNRQRPGFKFLEQDLDRSVNQSGSFIEAIYLVSHSGIRHRSRPGKSLYW